jgi:hypothetical protein
MEGCSMIFTRRFGALRARRVFPAAPEALAEQERILDGVLEDGRPQEKVGSGDESAA